MLPVFGLMLASMLSCPIPVPDEVEVPWEPSPRRLDYPWMSRMEWCERFRANLENPDRAHAQLVFMGDSITQGWTDVARDVWDEAFGSWHPLRLGIGGDRTQNILWRIDHGELDGLHPKVLVLLIGINNLRSGDTPADTVRGLETIIDRMREKLPETRLLVLGVLPSGAQVDDAVRTAIRQTNSAFKHLQPGVYTRDIGSAFLEADGSLRPEVMPDFVHPSHLGYEIFAKALLPILDEITLY